MSVTQGSVAVLGGGAFGRALASAVVRARGETLMWSRSRRDPPVEGVRVTEILDDTAQCELLLLAVPSAFASGVLQRVAPRLDGGHFIVHVSRGLVDDDLNPMSHLVRATTPVRRIGALAGPLTAQSLAEGHPAACIVGSDFPEVIESLRSAIGSPRLRVYGTPDIIGVELASALTGLLLFGLGYARGMGLTPATVGMLATRGLAEITRVGQALGARPETFTGLAGVGDLLAAVAGERRPEMIAGEAVAAGRAPSDALAEAEVNVESDVVALRVAKLADRLQVATPVCSTIAGLLSGDISGKAAIEGLMRRRVASE